MKLLIIDDEEEILRSLETFLTLRDYNVLTASDPERGLELHEGSDVKLVLLDINMPGMDGLDVLDEIQDRDYSTEVIMITGYNSLDKTLEAREKGATEFLLKPFEDMDQVARIVDEAADRIKRWHRALQDGLEKKREQRSDGDDQ